MKFAAATCALEIFHVLPAAVFQLNSGGQLKPTSGERLAALLGKSRGAIGAPFLGCGLRGPLTPS